MTAKKPVNFLSNKELLLEIHRSKISFCQFSESKYSEYHAVLSSKDRFTLAFAEKVLSEIKKRKKDAPGPETVDDLVFRVMTYEHVPLCDDKKKRSRTKEGEGHLRVNFPPFKHYIYRDGDLVEVGRSHWKGNFEEGVFHPDKGQVTERLAKMYLTLAHNYSMKSNWRGYSYRDEMRDNAIDQLFRMGLLFNEAKGDNPFAFYTTLMRNCFIRVAIGEKRHQSLRDDLLIACGSAPSYTRQVEDELAQKFAGQPVKAPAAKRPGRKAKSASITEDTLLDSEFNFEFD